MLCVWVALCFFPPAPEGFEQPFLADGLYVITLYEAAYGFGVRDALLAAGGEHAVKELGVKKVLYAAFKDTDIALGEIIITCGRLSPVWIGKAQAKISGLSCRRVAGAFAEQFVQAVAEVTTGWQVGDVFVGDVGEVAVQVFRQKGFELKSDGVVHTCVVLSFMYMIVFLSIRVLCPAPGRALLGSGEECSRLRGGGCPAPGRKRYSGEGLLRACRASLSPSWARRCTSR